jgi:hypothetical protein
MHRKALRCIARTTRRGDGPAALSTTRSKAKTQVWRRRRQLRMKPAMALHGGTHTLVPQAGKKKGMQRI